MYNKIAYATNAYVVEAIVNQINDSIYKVNPKSVHSETTQIHKRCYNLVRYYLEKERQKL